MSHVSRLGLSTAHRTIYHSLHVQSCPITSAQQAVKEMAKSAGSLTTKEVKILDTSPVYTSFSISLAEKEVYIPSVRLLGPWKDRISRLPLSPSEKNISLRFWGRYGKPVVDELEHKLNFKFNDEISSFIEEVGNLQFNGNDILIAGNEDATYTCITETEDVGLLKSGEPTQGVKIMDNGGMSYILHTDGSIKAYEHTYINPDGVIFTYDSLYDLIHKSIQELCNTD